MTAPLPVRTCLGCGQTDDHPRHVITMPDHSEVGWHMDCHTRANPPCEVCKSQIAGAKGATGHELREHLVNNTTAVGAGSES
jgi:hypothetical protein